MKPTSVFSPRRPVRSRRLAAAARNVPSLLAAAVLTLPAAGGLRAQSPGTIDPGFTPAKAAATVYAVLFENYGPNDPRNRILAAGDGAYDETNLQPSGIEKGGFITPVYGSETGRIVFTAAPERFTASDSDAPKIFLGGFFGQSASQIASKTPAQNIVRIFPDGAQDTAFNPGAGTNNYVTAILPLADGKLVVGGLFTTFNNEKRLRIVRLNNDGSIDESFNSSSAIDADVLTLAEGINPSTGQPDGSVLVGGIFNHVGGQPVTKLARLDASGNLDPTFKPVIDTRVIAIAVQPTGKIVIGGEFTRINGTSVSRLARLNHDGSLDSSFSGSVSGEPSGGTDPVSVYVLRPISNGKIYVGGNFTEIDGATRRYLGVVNPNGTVGAFDPGTTIYDEVQSIFVQPNGRVLVGETLGPKIGTVYQPTLIRLFGATTTN